MNVLAEMQVFITESSFWPYLFVKVEFCEQIELIPRTYSLRGNVPVSWPEWAAKGNLKHLFIGFVMLYYILFRKT